MQLVNGIGDVKAEGPFVFLGLNAMRIDARVNDHGRMSLSGFIRQEDMPERNLCGETVTVWGSDEKRPLFSGVVSGVSVTETGGLCEASVECRSFTALLDQAPYSRSFQNTERRYRDLLEEAGKRFGAENRIVVTAPEAKKRTGVPVIQYHETDWEFLKRMAGRLHTVIVPEITWPLAQVSVGCVQGKRYELEEGETEACEESLDLGRFRRSGSGRPGADYLSYRIRTGWDFNLCGRIRFRGREWRVVETHLFSERGALKREYVLGAEAGFCLEEGYNRAIRGASLPGRVIERKEGMARLHLDMDPQQEPEEAHWYPYTPVTGNIMYSVPEAGTRVLLNIKSMREEDAAVGCCVRMDPVCPLPADVKAMWAGGKKYTAAPDYMGFESETGGALDGALILDNELGIVAYAKRGLRLRAKGAVILASRGNVTLSGVTGTRLSHPKAKEEQAWIAMDCGRMRMAGSFMEHSAMAASEEAPRSGKDGPPAFPGMQPPDSLSQIPQSNKSDIRRELEPKGDAYNSVPGMAGEGGGGKVKQLKERIDTEDEGVVEKEAYIYAGGHYSHGEVRGGATFVTSNYGIYLNTVFGEDSIYRRSEPVIDEETGERRYYVDELYNRSVESLANMIGCLDILSSWEKTDDCKIIVFNSKAKDGPYQLVRRGREVKMRLYMKINAYEKWSNEDPNVRSVKPYENEEKEEEKKGWFGKRKDESTGEDYRNYTFYDFIMAGIHKWEGLYENQYQTYKEHWWEDGIRLCYDDFGLDGAVNVKIEVCSPTEEHPKGTRVYVFDNREKLIDEKKVYDEGADKMFDIVKSDNWPMVWNEDKWSILNVGTVLLFTRQKSDEKKHDYSYKSSRFLAMISHEFGHVWGLRDAYFRKNVPGWREAKETKEVSKDNMMRTDGEIQPNDIEMILMAWKYNQSQRYADFYGSKFESKSEAIKYRSKEE